MPVEHEAPEEVIQALRQKVLDASTSLPAKYRALFALRNLKGPSAEAALICALQDDSALFRHEVAYCLGQRQDPAAIATLRSILVDDQEHPMVRHEAGEALGAIGTPECFNLLRDFSGDPCLELRSLLLDEDAPIFKRYTALFALRNKGGREEVAALEDSLRSRSALLKHEVAYVLGQVQDRAAIDALEQVLGDASENAMVRHEAAEALGSIADRRCVKLLEDFSSDPEPIVAHSCIVALDMLEFEESGDFQYADEGQSVAQSGSTIAVC
ncbi:hypothetical protein WJX75_002559 [Coccomyxa subellipsoidea]|uniref:Deoxyhypusine hydroxylase n=1 Tax=Coccomyxa subellipsoidea TaxID=248742 RepID=A0ABR2YMG2_9CHLO